MRVAGVGGSTGGGAGSDVGGLARETRGSGVGGLVVPGWGRSGFGGRRASRAGRACGARRARLAGPGLGTWCGPGARRGFGARRDSCAGRAPGPRLLPAVRLRGRGPRGPRTSRRAGPGGARRPFREGQGHGFRQPVRLLRQPALVRLPVLLREQLRELGQEFRHRRPQVRVLLQAPADELRARRQAAQVRLFVDGAEVHRVRRARPERSRPGARVGQDRAQGEHVAGGADRPARHLLGRHEARAADHHARLCQDAGLGGDRDAEVDHPRSVPGEQHVGRLQVPVDEPGAVDRLQGLDQPRSEDEQGAPRPRPVHTDRLVQRDARNVGGGEPGGRTLGVGVDDGRGEEARHTPGRVHLAGEPAPERGVLRQLGAHHLHRDHPAAGGAAQVHAAHPARAQAREDAVAPQLARVRRPQLFQSRPQCHPAPGDLPATITSDGDGSRGVRGGPAPGGSHVRLTSTPLRIKCVRDIAEGTERQHP